MNDRLKSVDEKSCRFCQSEVKHVDGWVGVKCKRGPVHHYKAVHGLGDDL